MQRLFPEAGDLAFMQCVESEYRRRPVIVTRSGLHGRGRVRAVHVPGHRARACGASCSRRWRRSAAQPCGLAARDVLRLEMGYPLYGQDLFESVDGARGRARRGRSRSTRASSAAERRSLRQQEEGLPEPAARAADAGATAHPARPLPGVRRGSADRRGHERDVLTDCCRRGSGSPTSGRPTWPAWATWSRSTSGDGGARRRSCGRRSSIATRVIARSGGPELPAGDVDEVADRRAAEASCVRSAGRGARRPAFESGITATTT